MNVIAGADRTEFSRRVPFPFWPLCESRCECPSIANRYGDQMVYNAEHQLPNAKSQMRLHFGSSQLASEMSPSPLKAEIHITGSDFREYPQADTAKAISKLDV